MKKIILNVRKRSKDELLYFFTQGYKLFQHNLHHIRTAYFGTDGAKSAARLGAMLEHRTTTFSNQKIIGALRGFLRSFVCCTSRDRWDSENRLTRELLKEKNKQRLD